VDKGAQGCAEGQIFPASESAAGKSALGQHHFLPEATIRGGKGQAQFPMSRQEFNACFHGKEAEDAKALGLKGWDYRRHLVARALIRRGRP
jgi:hypothetical protein